MYLHPENEDEEYTNAMCIEIKSKLKISININRIKDSSFLDLIKSLFHEQRHIYQHDWFGSFPHDPAERLSWLHGRVTYPKDIDPNNREDVEEYFNNVLEVDARDYSDRIIQLIK